MKEKIDSIQYWSLAYSDFLNGNLTVTLYTLKHQRDFTEHMDFVTQMTVVEYKDIFEGGPGTQYNLQHS